MLKPIIYLFIGLATVLLARCSSSDAKKQNPGLTTSRNDLAGQTFDAAYDGDVSEYVKTAQSFVIFGSDTTGLFRTKKGSIMNQKAFNWQFAGDSLRLQFPKDSIELQGRKLVYTPKPIMYVVIKEKDGFLLKSKKDQILLTVQK